MFDCDNAIIVAFSQRLWRQYIYKLALDDVCRALRITDLSLYKSPFGDCIESRNWPVYLKTAHECHLCGHLAGVSWLPCHRRSFSFFPSKYAPACQCHSTVSKMNMFTEGEEPSERLLAFLLQPERGSESKMLEFCQGYFQNLNHVTTPFLKYSWWNGR